MFLARLGGVVCALGLFWPVSAFPASEAYLAAVKADVTEFDTGEFRAPPQSEWTGSEEASGEGTATLKGFEDFLKGKFRGTYILYRGLDESARVRIWEDYVQSGDLGAVRTAIFSARSKRPRRSYRRSSIGNLPHD